MTDQEKLAELRNRIDEAMAQTVYMPVNRATNSELGYGPLIPDVAAAMPVPLWEAILQALDAE